MNENLADKLLRRLNPMGMHDGVNNLWVLRSGRGLNVDGFKDEVEAISYLIRSLLAKSTNDLSAAKARVEAAVTDALKHMDDDYEAPLRQDSKSAPEPACNSKTSVEDR